MDVSQENGATAVVVVNNSKYVVDGMVLANLGTTGSITAAQTAITSLPGFPNCLTLQCTIANPISGASDAVYVYQAVEGYHWSRLAFGSVSAQPVTISFWVLTPTSGTLAVSIRGGGYSYVADVPVTGGSWQYKTVTIPGNVAGTWNAGNTTGAILSFCFGSGSSRKAAGNTWLAVDAIATAATTNFFAATGVVYLSGVTVLPGTQAPTAAQSMNVMRPFDQELVTCKRYYEKSYHYAGLPGNNLQLFGGAAGYTGATLPIGFPIGMYFQFTVDKRASPTVTVYSPQTGVSGKAYDLSQAGDWPATVVFAQEKGGMATTTISSGATARLGMHWVADARL
jgi:hypothetical protein